MPEGLEAEIWRQAASVLRGRTIQEVWFDGRVGPDELAVVLSGRRIDTVRRRGKVVLVDTDGPTLGLHFGMTGRLVIDGRSPIERLEYASAADRAEWDRLRVFTGAAGIALRLNDPRRLGRLSLDPDLDHLGPDAFTLTAEQLERACHRRSVPVKTLLLDQSAVAGLGNLCADEVLFWAGVDPRRRACDVSTSGCAAIAQACRNRLPVMLDAGGSTHGCLTPDVRVQLSPCPHDGGPLQRSAIGGRTTVWCQHHQSSAP